MLLAVASISTVPPSLPRVRVLPMGWPFAVKRSSGPPERKVLPEVREGNEVAGKVTGHGAREFGLREGLPVLVGVIDGSAAMLVTEAKAGQLFNVTGSTDVLALYTNKPRPDEQLLTRALGVGRKWMSVATIAAAGSAIAWMKDQFH